MTDDFSYMYMKMKNSMLMSDPSIPMPQVDRSQRYIIESPPEVTVPGYEDVPQDLTVDTAQQRMHQTAVEKFGIVNIDQLKMDGTMAAASKDLYKLFEGETFDGDDEEAVQYGIDVMGEFYFNFLGPVGFSGEAGYSSPGGTVAQAAKIISNGNPRNAQAFLYVLEQYERLPMMGEGAMSRMFKGMVADPSNWAAALSLGTGKVLQAGASKATQEGIKQSLKALAKKVVVPAQIAARHPTKSIALSQAAISGIEEERLVDIERTAGAEIPLEAEAARVGVASAIGGTIGAALTEGGKQLGKSIADEILE